MMPVAAVDIRGGKVVQLVGGDAADVRVELEDPVAVAMHWAEAGFEALHVVDLDAAMSTGDNSAVIAAIIGSVNVPVQVAGGIRTDERVDRWLDAGAARVVVGTRAILDEPWLRAQAGRHERRVVVAADVRGGRIATHGWTQSTALAIDAFLDSVACAPLAGVLVTDIDREGRMGGADVALFERLAAATPHPLIASGGITGPADLTALAAGGVAGAVLGMALYTGAFPSYPILRRNP